MGKRKSKAPADEPADTIEHIIRESGVIDESLIARLVRNLKPFWVKSTADAQARGLKIREIVEKESDDEMGGS